VAKSGSFWEFLYRKKVPFLGIKQNGFYVEKFCGKGWGMIRWKIGEWIGERIGDFNLNFFVRALAEKCQSICGL